MCCCRLGGQTALNLAIDLAERGILGRYGVEMIGAKLESIKKAEDRDFKEAMRKAGLDLPRSGYARSMRDAMRIQKRLNFPVIIRASRTLGGSGGNFAFGPDDFGCRPGGSQHLTGARSLDRRVCPRLEGVRAGGDARPQRQRGDHLLHRKFRSHGVHTGDSYGCRAGKH